MNKQGQVEISWKFYYGSIVLMMIQPLVSIYLGKSTMSDIIHTINIATSMLFLVIHVFFVSILYFGSIRRVTVNRTMTTISLCLVAIVATLNIPAGNYYISVNMWMTGLMTIFIISDPRAA